MALQGFDVTTAQTWPPSLPQPTPACAGKALGSKEPLPRGTRVRVGLFAPREFGTNRAEKCRHFLFYISLPTLSFLWNLGVMTGFAFCLGQECLKQAQNAKRERLPLLEWEKLTQITLGFHMEGGEGSALSPNLSVTPQQPHPSPPQHSAKPLKNRMGSFGGD